MFLPVNHQSRSKLKLVWSSYFSPQHKSTTVCHDWHWSQRLELHEGWSNPSPRGGPCRAGLRHDTVHGTVGKFTLSLLVQSKIQKYKELSKATSLSFCRCYNWVLLLTANFKFGADFNTVSAKHEWEWARFFGKKHPRHTGGALWESCTEQPLPKETR